MRIERERRVKVGVAAVLLVPVLALSTSVVGGSAAHAAGSTSLTTFGVPVAEDFNTLASTGTSSTLPNGWHLAETGSNANTIYNTGTGSSNTGDTYSFGSAASTDRAFGGLQSGSLVPTIGTQLTNNTPGTITSLAVAFTGERWRLGTASRPDRIDAQYSTNATSLTTGNWTDIDALDYGVAGALPPLGLLDGNTAAHRSAVSSTITGLAIPMGADVWLRWVSFDATGADDGLAIDDFSITPLGVPADSAPAVASVTPGNLDTNIVIDSNITVTFSEPVDVTGTWFTITCSGSGAHPATVTGGPTTFTLDPTTDFANSDNCSVNIVAANVADQDGNDPPDEMEADYLTAFSTFGPDNAPAVTSTVPADGAVNVPLNQNITVNFSEPVNVGDPWYTLECTVSGVHTAAQSGGPTSFVLNPTADFVYGENCTLTVIAGAVTDQDANDPPNTMTLDFTVGFATEIDPCLRPYTSASAIQGSGASAAITGVVVTTQGVVVGDYEGASPALRGFYMQDLTGDANPATSDAIFVFNGNANSVSVGQVVRVTGTAGEFSDQTQLSSVTNIRQCGLGSVAPVDVTLPFASSTEAERFEGMLVNLSQTLYVTEHFQLGRFGQVVVSSDARLSQPTNVVAPGATAAALQAANNLRRIIIDDASQGQNPDPILFGRGGNPLSAPNTLRGGDTVTGLTGVMTYTWAGNAASGNAYRVRPINALGGSVPNFQPSNPRPSAAPAVGGTTRVAGMNLLNFFNTFGATACTGGVGGAVTECRGAGNATEFGRQWPKTVAAIVGTGADIIGVNEIENDGYGGASALSFLVSQLNAATAPGTYAYVDVDTATGQTNALGTDAIKVGVLYKPAFVTANGTAALNSVAFVNGGDGAPRSRPALAQTFTKNDTGAVFTVAVNHLKSKGSACDSPDLGDGQGNCNEVRTNSANLLAAWLATDPTGSGDPDHLIVGDLNSYAKEDPIAALQSAGFTNLIELFNGQLAYSYVFDGQWGYLDHALANGSMLGQIDGVADWHINADEPGVLDYNTDFKTPGLIASLYATDEFRVSDHDPVIVGLTPNAPPTVDIGGPYTVAEGGSVTLSATGSDPNGDALTYEWDLDGIAGYETSGQTVTFDAALLDGPSSPGISVRASDPLGLSDVESATVTVTNVAPTASASFNAPGGVACGANNASLTVSFTDPAPADTHSAVIDWGDGSALQTISAVTSGTAVPHTYAAAGAYSATVTVTDDDGGATTVTASVAVNYTVLNGGFLPPINPDGTSVFKYRSTIPVKIAFANCDGSRPAGIAPTISVALMSGSTPVLQINEPESTSAADTSGVMRWSTNQYIYNLATRPLPDPSGTYRITVTIPATGQTVTVNFGLR